MNCCPPINVINSYHEVPADKILTLSDIAYLIDTRWAGSVTTTSYELGNIPVKETNDKTIGPKPKDSLDQ